MFRTIFVGIFLMVAWSASVAFGGSFELSDNPSSRNVEAIEFADNTAEENAFARRWSGERSLADLVSPEELRSFKILFVPGFLSDPKITLEEISPRFGGYFYEQMEWLREHQLIEDEHFFRIKLDSEETPLVNSRVVSEEIIRSRKPVILVTHSKGGIDSLAALLRSGPKDFSGDSEYLWTPEQIQSKVAGWIALQVPFYGTPSADRFMDESSIMEREIGQFLIEVIFGGDIGSVKTLTTDYREKYAAYYESEIAELTARIPNFISFGSYLSGNYDTGFMAPFHMDLIARGFRSDGSVPLVSSHLEGSKRVWVHGVDHLDTVMSTSSDFTDYERIRLFLTLLSLVIEPAK